MIARPVYALAFLDTTEWLVNVPLVPPIATAEGCVLPSTTLPRKRVESMIRHGMLINRWDVSVIWDFGDLVVNTGNANQVQIRWAVMATKRDGIARAVVYVTTRVVNVDVLEDLEEKNAVSSYSILSDHKILSSLIIIVIVIIIIYTWFNILQQVLCCLSII